MNLIPRLFLTLVFVAAAVNAQNTKPAATPTPTPSPIPTATPTPVVETLESLQSKIRSRILYPELRRGQVGVKIISLNSGKVIFEQNSEKYFMPASNMKNFTVATALEKLTPDYRFVTSVYAASQPDSSGTIKGDLRIYGRGDVSMSMAFYPDQQPDRAIMRAGTVDSQYYYNGIDKLAERIAAAGVKRIEGDIIADDTFFRGDAVNGEWERDDLQTYYGAEVSSLGLNDNAFDIWIFPGSAGTACTVKVMPLNPVIRINNLCTTSAASSARTVRIGKRVDQNVIDVTGTLPAGGTAEVDSVSVSRPAELFAALLKDRLTAKGIDVRGRTAAIDASAAKPTDAIEITKLESPPLSLIAARTMKPSQNMYTETLLWTLGEQARQSMGTQASERLGREVVKTFLTSIGIPSDGIIQHDGSGLSRHNLVTPAAVVRLYQYMAKESRYAQAWRDSLTIAGVDGTLKNRMAGTKASGNLRGKTGTIDQVSALSGYVRTASGEELVVSFIVNGVNTGRDRTSMMDDIVVSLANFTGRID